MRLYATRHMMVIIKLCIVYTIGDRLYATRHMMVIIKLCIVYTIGDEIVCHTSYEGIVKSQDAILQ